MVAPGSDSFISSWGPTRQQKYPAGLFTLLYGFQVHLKKKKKLQLLKILAWWELPTGSHFAKRLGDIQGEESEVEEIKRDKESSYLFNLYRGLHCQHALFSGTTVWEQQPQREGDIYLLLAYKEHSTPQHTHTLCIRAPDGGGASIKYWTCANLNLSEGGRQDHMKASVDAGWIKTSGLTVCA